jgi:hypothetical protein
MALAISELACSQATRSMQAPDALESQCDTDSDASCLSDRRPVVSLLLLSGLTIYQELQLFASSPSSNSSEKHQHFCISSLASYLCAVMHKTCHSLPHSLNTTSTASACDTLTMPSLVARLNTTTTPLVARFWSFLLAYHIVYCQLHEKASKAQQATADTATTASSTSTATSASKLVARYCKGKTLNIIVSQHDFVMHGWLQYVSNVIATATLCSTNHHDHHGHKAKSALISPSTEIAFYTQSLAHVDSIASSQLLSDGMFREATNTTPCQYCVLTCIESNVWR